VAPALGGERAAEGPRAEEKPSSRGQGILARRFPVEKDKTKFDKNTRIFNSLA
jgi:hypothetical protein